jgi:hypothetical protein
LSILPLLFTPIFLDGGYFALQQCISGIIFVSLNKLIKIDGRKYGRFAIFEAKETTKIGAESVVSFFKWRRRLFDGFGEFKEFCK